MSSTQSNPVHVAGQPVPGGPGEGMSRRGFLATSAAAAGSATLLAGTGRLAGATVRPKGQRLVVVFLRGGADGMSVVAPVADPNYSLLRPSIGVRTASALPLDGVAADRRFAFHPAARRLAGLYRAGKVAVVPAAGLPIRTRSHFDAQAAMEDGSFAARDVQRGWVGRWVSGTALAGDSPLRAVAIGDGPPASFRGATCMSATSLRSLSLLSWGPPREHVAAHAERLYAGQGVHPLLAAAVAPTLTTLTSLSGVGDGAPPAGWPTSEAGVGLWPVARLIEMGMPVEVAHVDGGHWDQHNDMGAPDDPAGQMSKAVAGLDAAIGSFFDRIGPEADRTTMVVMTEFGRRAGENSSGGTDHGTAAAMFVIGGGVQPGVKGTWPGLAAAELVEGDLRTTVDYRQVLAEVVSRRMGADSMMLDAVFPRLRTSPADWVGVCT